MKATFDEFAKFRAEIMTAINEFKTSYEKQTGEERLAREKESASQQKLFNEFTLGY